jgi:hypothetical protein
VDEAGIAELRLGWRLRDEARLLAALTALTGPDPRLPDMIRHALTPDALGTEVAPRNTQEAAFLDQIGRVHAHRLGRTAPRRLQTAAMALDWVARDAGPPGWSAAQWLNFLLLRSVAPADPVAVVATVRDEGLNLVEFVAHYRVLGAGEIFLYTNDNVDGSDALLARLAEHGLITLIASEVAPAFSPQRKAYGHALNFLAELYDHAWVLFVDADELLVPAPRHAGRLAGLIGEVEDTCRGRLPGAVLLDWKWYVSGCRYAWRPGLQLERFVHAIPMRGFKSLVRLDDVLSMIEVHFPTLCPGSDLVDGDLAPVAEARPWGKDPASAGAPRLNHYWTKSFEEFSIKKARGDALARNNHPEWDRGFELFFKWNAAETAANLAPPPPALASAVRAEHDRIMALPGIGEAVREVIARIPALLARFDEGGGLAAIYRRLLAEHPPAGA